MIRNNILSKTNIKIQIIPTPDIHNPNGFSAEEFIRQTLVLLKSEYNIEGIFISLYSPNSTGFLIGYNYGISDNNTLPKYVSGIAMSNSSTIIIVFNTNNYVLSVRNIITTEI
jgi:hypothetical protein